MMIGVVIGTRPELIKCLPLFQQSDRYRPIFVLQHTDLLQEHIQEDSLVIPLLDHSANRLDGILASILLSPVLSQHRFSALLVQGDTAVACGAALVAYHHRIPLIHLEAGLRTNNKDHPWPEEGYRRIIDAIADLALCPSIGARTNLERENYRGTVEIVGNTSIDVIASYGLAPRIGNKVLITLHRRENWPILAGFFEVLEQLAQRHPHLEFILPLHPNPEIQELARRIFHSVRLVNPMNHLDLCKLLEECNCVISDSGGIQEEASFLGKRVFCCRFVTERDELGEGGYLTMTPLPDALLTAFCEQTTLLPGATVYGTGGAAAAAHAAIIRHLDPSPCHRSADR